VLGQTNACADYTKSMLNNMCVVSRQKERYRICLSLLGELSSFFIRASSSEIAVVIFMLSIYFPARDLSACQLLQLIRRAQDKASVDNVRLPEEASELVRSSWRISERGWKDR
jgi:hypothetical protein